MSSFATNLRSVLLSGLLMSCVMVGCNSSGGSTSPQDVLTATDFQKYKEALIAETGNTGCACTNSCNPINAPEGQQGCHDKQPLQIIYLTDPTDGVRKAVRINCHCECDAPEMGAAARCMLKDHLIGWPKPVDPNVIWGPSPE